jgi:hypothetical protein
LHTSSAGATATGIDDEQTLNAVACPAASQCTAVDNAGLEVTFKPASPPGTPMLKPIAPGTTAGLSDGRLAVTLNARAA